MKKCTFPLAAMTAISLCALTRGATAPSTYLTIDVTGPASQFDNVPVAASNSPDPNAIIDPVQLKIANDSTHLYVQISYSPAVNPQSDSGVFTAIDSDNNPSTGDAIYGSSTIGSNAAFQNDFPFTQTSSSFNSGGMLTSATSSASGASIYAASPYNATTTYQNISFPLDLNETDSSAGGYNGTVFPAGTPFTLEFYTSPSSGDAVVLGPVTYTLATADSAPEPGSISAALVGGLALLRRRRMK